MEKVKIIAKNTFILIATKAICNGLYFVTFIYIAKHLGSTDFGKLSFALAFTLVAGLLSDFGIKTYILREVAKDKSNLDTYLGNTLLIKSVFALINFILIFIIINILNYPSETVSVIYILSLSIIANSFTLLGNFIFRALAKTKYELLVSFVGRVFFLCLSLLCILFNLGLIPISLAFLGGNIISFLLCWIIIFKKFSRPKLEINFALWKLILKNSFPFVMTEIFTEIYFRIDLIMLSMMKGDTVVGFYNAAYQLIEGLAKLIPSSFMGALLPILSYYFISSEESFKNYLQKGFEILIILALPLTIGLFMLSERFTLLIYGKEFFPSIKALQILSTSLIFIFINSLLGTALTSINKQHLWTIGAGICMVVNIVLNFILIPPFSYVGSSYATVITEGVLFLSGIWFLKQYISVPFNYLLLGKVLIGCLVMSVLIYNLKFISLPLLIPVGIVTYLIPLFLLNTFSAVEIKIVKEIFAKTN